MGTRGKRVVDGIDCLLYDTISQDREEYALGCDNFHWEGGGFGVVVASLIIILEASCLISRFYTS